MEITFQPVLDKHYRKMQCEVSKLIYKHNKFKWTMQGLDVGFFVFFMLPIIYLSVEVDVWAVSFYEWYQSDWVYWVGDFLFIAGLLMLLYAISFRPYLNVKAFQRQVSDNIVRSHTTLRIEHEGLSADTDIGRSLYYYAQIRQIVNMQSFLVIIINSGLFIAAPHSAFDNEEQRLRFETALREKVPHG